jgi:enoyl-CoA hydratase/carnithine racemase
MNITMTDIAERKVVLTREDAIARLSFNKPERVNAMSLEMCKGSRMRWFS